MNTVALCKLYHCTQWVQRWECCWIGTIPIHPPFMLFERLGRPIIIWLDGDLWRLSFTGATTRFGIRSKSQRRTSFLKQFFFEVGAVLLVRVDVRIYIDIQMGRGMKRPGDAFAFVFIADASFAETKSARVAYRRHILSAEKSNAGVLMVWSLCASLLKKVYILAIQATLSKRRICICGGHELVKRRKRVRQRCLGKCTIEWSDEGHFGFALRLSDRFLRWLLSARDLFVVWQKTGRLKR